MQLQIAKKEDICGTIAAPSSKSCLHRFLICSALSDGETEISANCCGDDIEATMDCLRSLGAEVKYRKGIISVKPIAGFPDKAQLDCRESASTLRFLLPLAASFVPETRFTGSGRLPERPVLPLLTTLSQNGADVSDKKLPFTLRGGLNPGVFKVRADISSQFVSGLLMALPLLPGDSEIVLEGVPVSKPYIQMTVDIMENFGVDVQACKAGYHIKGGRHYITSGSYRTDGDWSAAAAFLCMGALGGKVSVAGLGAASVQGDSGICGILRDFGAEVSSRENIVTASVKHLTGREIDITHMPDLLPLLSVLGAGARGRTLIKNAARLRHKESDRLAASVELINFLGGQADIYQNSLEIHGTGLHGGRVSAHGDHRIVMAAAAAAVISDEPVIIDGAESVKKSYPEFFKDLKNLGFDIFEL